MEGVKRIYVFHMPLFLSSALHLFPIYVESFTLKTLICRGNHLSLLKCLKKLLGKGKKGDLLKVTFLHIIDQAGQLQGQKISGTQNLIIRF